MYNRKSQGDTLTAAITAGIGALVVTSFAVSQGQHPLVGLIITVLAVLITLVGDRFLAP
jgi:CDP-diglyceride synthetase